MWAFLLAMVLKSRTDFVSSSLVIVYGTAVVCYFESLRNLTLEPVPATGKRQKSGLSSRGVGWNPAQTVSPEIRRGQEV